MSRFAIFSFVVLGGAGSAEAQRIGLYFDEDFTVTSGPAPQIGSDDYLWVVAELGGEVADGLTVAEFSITGVPDGWLWSFEKADAANIILGDPFSFGGGGGTDIAFPVCQATTPVLLGKAQFLGDTDEAFDLVVEMRHPPTNPDYEGPIFTACDEPFYTAHAVEGGTATVEPCAIDCGGDSDSDTDADTDTDTDIDADTDTDTDTDSDTDSDSDSDSDTDADSDSDTGEGVDLDADVDGDSGDDGDSDGDPAAIEDAAADPGCACRTPASPRGGLFVLFLAGLALVVSRRSVR